MDICRGKCLARLLLMITVAIIVSGCGNKSDNAAVYIDTGKGIKLQASIAEVYGNRDAIVTVVSDDGIYSSGIILNSLADKYKLNVTVAGAIKFVKPNLNGWYDIAANKNVELVNHSYNHIRMENGREIGDNIDELIHEIVDADKWYENEFPEEGEQIVFVCPENQMSDIGYKIISNGNFWAVRRGDRGYNSLNPENGTKSGQWFNLMCQGICDEGVTETEREDWVRTAIDEHMWLIEMWHCIADSENGLYQTILTQDADTHLSYLCRSQIDGSIWIANFTDATKYLREKQNCICEAYDDENGTISIRVKLTDPKMTLDTFSQPLTLKIQLDEMIENCVYKDIDGKDLETHKGNENESYLLVDIIPNGEWRMISYE